MRQNVWTMSAVAVLVALIWEAVPLADNSAQALDGWQGQRRISYQKQKDLFYNEYVGPGPSGAVAAMYPSPQPVPPSVGHTYVTYQPLMPHEYLYRHQRAYYTHNYGAGWTRTNVRYGTFGNRLQDWASEWAPMRSLQVMGLENDLYRPGLRF
jgi:hypothetical protein